jgi:hypothetical protein
MEVLQLLQKYNLTKTATRNSRAGKRSPVSDLELSWPKVQATDLLLLVNLLFRLREILRPVFRI